MALGMTTLSDVELASAMTCAVDDITWISTGETVLEAGSTNIITEALLQIDITCGGSSTEDINLHYRYSADGGTTKDTEDIKTFATTVEADAGNHVIFSYRITGMFNWLDVGIENIESSITHSVDINATVTKLTGFATS